MPISSETGKCAGSIETERTTNVLNERQDEVTAYLAEEITEDDAEVHQVENNQHRQKQNKLTNNLYSVGAELYL